MSIFGEKATMDDVSKFIEIIKGSYSCVSIVTHEEFEALDVVRRAAKKLEWKMQIWSAGQGVRDGLCHAQATARRGICYACSGLIEGVRLLFSVTHEQAKR